jgi:hypothetical protein
MADVDMAPAPAQHATAAAAEPPQSALEQERDRLANALAQLERSNGELRRELDDQRARGVPLDRDFKDALQDNVVVVAKYRARVAALDEEIRRVKGGGAGGVGAGGRGLGVVEEEPRDVGGLGVGVGQENEAGMGAAGAAAAAATGTGGGGATTTTAATEGEGAWV